MVIEVSDWDKASLKRKKERLTQQTQKTTQERFEQQQHPRVFIKPKPSMTATGYHNIPTDINQLQAVGEDQCQKLNYHAELL